MKRSDFRAKNVDLAKTAQISLSDLDEKQLSEITKLRELCERFKRGSGHSNEELVTALKKAGYSRATFYRRRKEYEQRGTLSALVPTKSNVTRKRRTSDEVEAIIQSEIKSLQKQGVTCISDIHNSIEGAIYGANLKKTVTEKLITPSLTTVRNRVLAIPTHEAAIRALGKQRAERAFGPLTGKTPEQKYALSRVQIDHTLVDVCVIDSETGLPLRRPWITLAIDEMSRAILGVLLSFEAPSSTKLARFMVHMMYPKDELLAEHEIDFEWPMYGKPKVVFTDNGSDFTGRAFGLGNLEHNIIHDTRPVGGAHYGGQIERLIGTAMHRVKLLPGRTRSAWMEEIHKFDPSKTATMTMERLERWILQWVTGDYHCTQREELNFETPLDKWKKTFAPGCNDPSPPRIYPKDRHQTYCSYLPIARRSLRRGFFEAFALEYWDDALEPFVRWQTSKKFEIRFDTNDVSFIYFRNPKDGKFIRINCKDRTFPSMSLTQWKLTRNLARETGRNPDCVESRKRAAFLMRKERRESEVEAKRLKRAYAAERKRVNKNLNSRTIPKKSYPYASKDGELPTRKKVKLPKKPPIVERVAEDDLS